MSFTHDANNYASCLPDGDSDTERLRAAAAAAAAALHAPGDFPAQLLFCDGLVSIFGFVADTSIRDFVPLTRVCKSWKAAVEKPGRLGNVHIFVPFEYVTHMVTSKMARERITSCHILEKVHRSFFHAEIESKTCLRLLRGLPRLHTLHHVMNACRRWVKNSSVERFQELIREAWPSRLQTLVLYVGAGDSLQTINNVVEMVACLHTLEHLELDIVGDTTRGVLHSYAPLQALPRLTSLRVRGVLGSSHFVQIAGIASLRHLDLNTYTSLDGRTALALFCSVPTPIELQSLTCCHIFEGDVAHLRARLTSLAGLRVTQFIAASEAHELYKLEGLRVLRCCRPGNFRQPMWQTLLFPTTLTALEFRGVNASELEYVTRGLAELPALTWLELKVDGSGVSLHLLRPLKKLRTLTLDVRNVCAEMLLSLIGITSLRTIHLVDVNRETIKHLAVLFRIRHSNMMQDNPAAPQLSPPQIYQKLSNCISNMWIEK